MTQIRTPDTTSRPVATAPSRRWTTFTSPIVSGEWLTSHLGSLVVADVRWSLGEGARRRDYDAGHIPGAVFVDLDQDLADPPSLRGGRHPLPDPERFARSLGRLGIGDGTPVVVYDDAGGSVAARLWWLLHTLGEPVAVLDGGLASWLGELAVDVPPVRPVPRRVRPWPVDRFWDADRVEDARAASDPLVIDARSAARFQFGDPLVDPRPGHIPGAGSAPWTGNLDEHTGRFLPRVELRRRFLALGATPERPTVAYCGSGVTACHDLLALELAGLHQNALYPGSWSAWGADPGRPAEC